MRIGVVTVTYNSAEVLSDFLNSLSGQQLQEFTVYAVDNASRDNSIEAMQCYSGLDLRVIANERNEGVATGNNIGISRALAEGCDYILLINNDTHFGPELFAQLYAAIQETGCDMCTPKIYFHQPANLLWYAGGRFRVWQGYRPTHEGYKKIDGPTYSTSSTAQYAPTCCVLFKAEVFAKVGMMDENYFAYYDDTDFFLRCRFAGLRLWYLAEARLWHKVSALTASNSDFSVRYLARNRVYYMKKFLPGWLSFTAYRLDLLRYGVKKRLKASARATAELELSAAREGWRLC